METNKENEPEIKTAKKRKSITNGNEEISFKKSSYTQSYLKFGREFQERLKTENALSAINEFIKYNENKDGISEYIKSGCSVKDLIDVLSSKNNKDNNYTLSSAVFTLLYSIIKRCVEHMPLILKNIEESCDELLHSRQSVIRSMLVNASSGDIHRKAVLKLFTGMVTLSVKLGKNVLNFLPIKTNIIRILADSRTVQDGDSLRITFINFLLACLVEGNTGLISDLLSRKGLLPSIIPGLINDHPNTVTSVLVTIRKQIVENIQISKTLKLHMFNTNILRHIFLLYDFQGPKTIKCKIDTTLDDKVRESAHELLLLLCTSHKYGLVFKGQDITRNKKNNEIILTLLEKMTKPWGDELKMDLIAEILKSCPEHLKAYLSLIEEYFVVSSNNTWIQAITFLRKIIDKQELPRQPMAKHFSKYVNTSLFPSVVVKSLKSLNDEMLHTNPTIRYNAVLLLLTCLRKIEIAIESNETLDNEQLTIFTTFLDEHIPKNLPSASKFLNAWISGIKNEGVVENVTGKEEITFVPDYTEYRCKVADVILLMNKMFPKCLDTVKCDKNVTLCCPQTDDTNVQFKSAQLTIIVHNPKPGQIEFEYAIKIFLRKLLDDEVTDDDVQFIRSTLKEEYIFGDFEDELLIWIYCFRQINNENIINILMAAINNLSNKHQKFMTVLSYAQSISIADNAVPNYITDEMDDDLNDYALIPKVRLSPLFVAFVYTLKMYQKKNELSEDICNFTSLVITHLLHAQLDVSGLKYIIDKYSNTFIKEDVYSYVNYWTQQERSEKLGFPTLPVDTVSRINQCLFLHENTLQEVIQIIEKSDEESCILLWRHCIFAVIKLHETNALKIQLTNNAKEIFHSLTKILSKNSIQTCLKEMLSNYYLYNEFKLIAKKSNLLTEMIVDIISSCYQNEVNVIEKRHLSSLFTFFRYKLFSNLMQLIKDGRKLSVLKYKVNEQLELLCASFSMIKKLLNSLSSLQPCLLYDESNGKLSEWSQLLAWSIQESSKCLDEPIDHDVLDRIFSNLKLLKRRNLNTDVVDNTIIAYLNSFPHFIKFYIDSMNEFELEDNNLALYLLSENENNREMVERYFCKIQDKKRININLVLKLVSITIGGLNESNQLTKEVVCRCFVNNVVEVVENEPDWLKDYFELYANVLDKYTDSESYENVYEKIERKWSSLVLTNEKCQIIYIIFKKMEKLEKLLESSVTQFVKNISTNQSYDCLLSMICKALDNLDDLQFIRKCPSWSNFVLLSLTHCLRKEMILKTFNKTCNVLFKSNDDEMSEDASMIFQRIISHSEFLNVMLGQSDIKCELLQLLFKLVTVNKSLMTSNHIPVFLGSYGATLSTSDQILLQILQWYENSGIRLSDCRPYLWGEAAVNHFSIRTQLRTSLSRQPLPFQVLDLLDIHIVQNTIKSFPIDRALLPGREIYEVERDKMIYDVAFVLPLMSHLLAPECRFSVQKFTRSGALALIILSLSSSDYNIRVAAYHCLGRFLAQLSSHDRQCQLWEQFILSIRNGVKEMDINNDTVPRLSCISTIFLSHMTFVISEPLHPLYKVLNNYLLAKRSFKLTVIQEFSIFFHNTDVTREHQEWILKVIRDGMRTSLDWKAAQESNWSKILLTYFSCVFCSLKTKVLILEIVEKCLLIPEGKTWLSTISIIPWIKSVCASISEENTNIILPLLNVVKVLMSNKNVHVIISVLIAMLPNLRKLRLDENTVKVYVKLFNEKNLYDKCFTIISEDNLESIIELSTPYMNLVKNIRNSLKFQCKSKIKTNDDSIEFYVNKLISNWIEYKT